MNNKITLEEIAITLIPKIGGVLTKQLIAYCGGVEEVFKKSKADLRKIPNIGEKLIDNIQTKGIFLEAEKILKQADLNNTQLLFYTHKNYPKRLLEQEGSPCLLYYKGNANLNSSKVLSFVGTRKATNYGKEVTQHLIKDLKKYNPIIVSGLAYGIDTYSHKFALEEGLSTIGVMATGMDIIYPDVNTQLAKNMMAQGGLLTEFSFGTKPEASRFPARNRIIAGMCDGIVVSETAKKGGTMITAEYGHNYNKDVFAVPNSIYSPMSEGCNHLIKIHKATICTSAEDIAYLLNWDLENDTSNQLDLFAMSQLSSEEKIVMDLLKKENPIHVDILSRKSKIGGFKLPSILLNLEMQGFIDTLPGKMYGIKRR